MVTVSPATGEAEIEPSAPAVSLEVTEMPPPAEIGESDPMFTGPPTIVTLPAAVTGELAVTATVPTGSSIVTLPAAANTGEPVETVTVPVELTETLPPAVTAEEATPTEPPSIVTSPVAVTRELPDTATVPAGSSIVTLPPVAVNEEPSPTVIEPASCWLGSSRTSCPALTELSESWSGLPETDTLTAP
jgi:hypothetical protein